MISRDSIETPLLCKLVDVNSYELLLMGRGNNDERRERIHRYARTFIVAATSIFLRVINSDQRRL